MLLHSDAMTLHVRIAIICLVTSLFLSTNDCQRTYQRSCECEKTVDGKCAYTLVLPLDAGGSTEPCKEGCKSLPPNPLDDWGFKVNTSLKDLSVSVDSLQRWSGEQAKMIVTMNNKLNSIEKESQGAARPGNVSSSDFQALRKNISEQASKIERLEIDLDSVNKTVASFMAHVSKILEDRNATWNRSDVTSSQRGTWSTGAAVSSKVNEGNLATSSHGRLHVTASNTDVGNRSRPQDGDVNFHRTTTQSRDDSRSFSPTSGHVATTGRHGNLSATRDGDPTDATTRRVVMTTAAGATPRGATSHRVANATRLLGTFAGTTPGETPGVRGSSADSRIHSSIPITEEASRLSNLTTKSPEHVTSFTYTRPENDVSGTQAKATTDQQQQQHQSHLTTIRLEYNSIGSRNDNKNDVTTAIPQVTQGFHSSSANVAGSEIHHGFTKSDKAAPTRYFPANVSTRNNFVATNKTGSDHSGLTDQKFMTHSLLETTTTSTLGFNGTDAKHASSDWSTKSHDHFQTSKTNDSHVDESETTTRSWEFPTVRDSNHSNEHPTATQHGNDEHSKVHLSASTGRNIFVESSVSTGNQIFTNGPIAVEHSPIWSMNNEPKVTDQTTWKATGSQPGNTQLMHNQQSTSTAHDGDKTLSHYRTSAAETMATDHPSGTTESFRAATEYSYNNNNNNGYMSTGSLDLGASQPNSGPLLRRKKRDLNAEASHPEGLSVVVDSLLSRLADLESRLKTWEERGRFLCSRKGLLLDDGKGPKVVLNVTSSPGVTRDVSGAWCMGSGVLNQSVNIDFNGDQKVFALVIKLDSPASRGFFYLTHEESGVSQAWNVYKNPEGTTQIFSVSYEETDRNYFKTMELWQPVTASSLRIHPIFTEESGRQRSCFSLDVIGCRD